MRDIYNTLNSRQQEAVFHTEGPAADPGRGGLRKDQGADSQNCISDR